jgi:hypothetical protein
MANLWLDTFLGKTGKYIIQFIDNYYIYLLPIILVYGVFLALASFNLKRIERRVIGEIIRQAKHLTKVNPNINYSDLIYHINPDWETIIKKSSFLPFISTESGFWVNKTNMFNVREIIMHDERKLRLVLQRYRIIPEDQMHEPRQNLYTEYFHRITKQQDKS